MIINKLSDIGILKALILNKKDLNNYVFSPNRIEIKDGEKYDIALVLGANTYDILSCRIKEAIKLYKKGIVKKVFLTGGIGYFSKNKINTEANIMKKHMLDEGVNEKDILVEDKSRNTYENIKNSVNKIKDIYGKNCRIVLVTSDFHIKRAKAMIEKISPFNIYSYGVLDNKHDIDKWGKSNFKTKKLIRTEALLLSWYQKKNIIDDQKVVDIDRVHSHFDKNR